MLSFECIKNEKSVYFLLTSAKSGQKIHKNFCMSNLFNYIAKIIFFDANIGHEGT